MTPLNLFLYGVAISGGLFCVLAVAFLFLLIWFYLVGGRGRE